MAEYVRRRWQATRSPDYVVGLTSYRHDAAADSQKRSIAAQTWLQMFVSATLRAILDAQAYASRIAELVEEWRAALGGVRKGSAAELLVAVLPGVPLVTVDSAARPLGSSAGPRSPRAPRLSDSPILSTVP